MSRAAVEIREAGAGDVDALMALYASARFDQGQLRAPVDSVRARLLRALQERSVRVLIACLAEQPVGYALITTVPLLPLGNSTGPSVEHLHVVPEHRRRGVGRALLRRAVVLAEAEGADQLACTVLPGDREYTRYLARLGFAPVVVRRAVPLTALRRRLSGESAGHLHTTDVVARRRSLRARLARAAADTVPIPVARPAARAVARPAPAAVPPVPSAS